MVVPPVAICKTPLIVTGFPVPQFILPSPILTYKPATKFNVPAPGLVTTFVYSLGVLAPNPIISKTPVPSIDRAPEVILKLPDASGETTLPR